MSREVVLIPIDEITIPPRLRPVDDAWTDVLAVSIAQHGLRQAIIVRPSPFGPGYLLVAGSHRLAAVKRIGGTAIDAEVLQLDDLAARLVEIDENLARRELSVLDRAIFLAERKRIYEELYPETRHGGARTSRKSKSPDMASWSAFSAATAAATGTSRRSVDRLLQIKKQLAPEAVEILRTSRMADNQSHLKALSELDASEQVAAARIIASGEARNLRDARIKAGFVSPTVADPDETAKTAFRGALARLPKHLRKWGLAEATKILGAAS